MGANKVGGTKKIDISVLIPTRGRPAGALRAIESMKPLGPHVEVLVGIDDDDETSSELRTSLSGISGVRVISSPRHVTLGALFNRLYGLSKGRIIMACPDDYVLLTKGWQRRVIDTIDGFPNGIGVGYLNDPTHPMMTTFPVLTRKTIEANTDGEFISSLFPFWFGDTWWDEVGDLLGIKVVIDVEVAQPDGRGLTKNIHDVSFWSELFHCMRPVRGGVARSLASMAYEKNTEGLTSCLARFPAMGLELFEKTKHLLTPEFAKKFEAMIDGEISPRYAEAKKRAEEFRETLPKAPKQLRVAICTPTPGYIHARTATALMAMTAAAGAAGLGLMSLTLEGSMITKSRNDIVDMALKHDADYLLFVDGDMIFPPDTLQRLLSHQKDIVGATYCKRVPPFETLGKIFPRNGADDVSMEEFAKGGLFEAALMPGGLMLIKADVFRKVPRLWYFETYKSPGATGTEAMKEYIRYNFAREVPEEVLSSLDGTALSRWLDEDRDLPGAYEYEYFSEDYNFCRKARRTGFKIFCDLSLTYEVRHIGFQEVASAAPKLGDAIVKPAALIPPPIAEILVEAAE